MLTEKIEFELEGCDVARAALAAGDVVGLDVVDASYSLTLPPRAEALLLVRRLPRARSFQYRFRRSFRLRG